MAKKTKTRFPSPLRLDIACGEHKKEGYFGIDCQKLKGVDMVVDLERFPWPFPNNSVSEATCIHYIEHTKDLIKFMNEVYRILKPGSKFYVASPYWTALRAWQDPTHVRGICEGTFLYFDRRWRELNHLSYYPIKTDFDFTFGYHYFPEWLNRADDARNFAAQHYFNVVSDIEVIMIKRVPEKKKAAKKPRPKKKVSKKKAS